MKNKLESFTQSPLPRITSGQSALRCYIKATAFALHFSIIWCTIYTLNNVQPLKFLKEPTKQNRNRLIETEIKGMVAKGEGWKRRTGI